MGGVHVGIINGDHDTQGPDWAYYKATQGFLGFDSANDLAEDYLKGDGTLCEKVNSPIQWQNMKASTAGFLAGLGGLIALPVMVPANISVVLLAQVRMIAAIAIMGAGPRCQG